MLKYSNYEVCAKLTQFIRRIEPKGITVSVGGEIGEVGQVNSTPEDLRVFMKGFNQHMGGRLTGLSKISIQTGTTHGGVVLPDGSMAQVKLDFETLRQLGEIARKEFGLGGAVQHGASTLPEDAIHKFAACQACEVHLATSFQNMIFDSRHFPEDLKQRIYAWLKMNAAHDAKQGETDEQFYYKTRKKAFGPFKKDIANLSQTIRDAIASEMEIKIDFLFKQLNAVNNAALVDKYVTLQIVTLCLSQDAAVAYDGEGAD